MYRTLGRNIIEIPRFSLIANADFPVKFTKCPFLLCQGIGMWVYELCNTNSTEESLHRGLTSDKTRITKSLASARWRGSHPPENFNMAGIFFLKRIQQNLFPDQTDGFMLR